MYLHEGREGIAEIELYILSLYILTRFQGMSKHDKANEKLPRGIQGEKSSKDLASSKNLVSTIGAQASL